MPLNTLQLSYRPRRRHVPQVVVILVLALLAWGLTLALAEVL